MAVEEKVKQIIVEQLQVDEAEVTPGASFQEDLGADSLDVVELVDAVRRSLRPRDSRRRRREDQDRQGRHRLHREERKSRERQVALEHRRVVITGLGLVCGVGNTAPEVWQQLLAGASGMAPIQGFDTTGLSRHLRRRGQKLRPAQLRRQKRSAQNGALHPLCLRRHPGGHGPVRPPDHAGDRRPRRRLHRLRHRRIRNHRARARQPAQRRPAQDLALLHSRRHHQHGGRPHLASATAPRAPSRPPPPPAPPPPTPSATPSA